MMYNNKKNVCIKGSFYGENAECCSLMKMRTLLSWIGYIFIKAIAETDRRLQEFHVGIFHYFI